MKAIKIYNNHSNVENKLPLSKMNLVLCKDNKHLYYGEHPYSYKLEYLESTGSQYINLHYNARGTDIVEVKIRSTVNNWNYNTTGTALTDYPLWNPIFGMQNSGTYKFWGTYVRSKSNNNYLMYFYNQSAGSGAYPNFTPALTATTVMNWYTYKFSSKTVYRDGSQLTGSNGGTVNDNVLTQKEIFLFATNDRTPIVNTSKIQIAWFKISDKNQNPILDMIPVRVGNIGYMYDKLSGQLYGNSGTGNFVCGPDIE